MAKFLVLIQLFTVLALLHHVSRSAAANDSKQSDESALMNIWNYQIERKVKTSIKYKMQDLAVWEEADTVESPASARRYYVTPPASLLPNSAICQYIAITNSFEVGYDIQLWEKDLPSAVVAGLKELALDIREDQIHPLPFYQARVIWNNPEQELNQLTLSSAWINNLKQQQVYRFRVAAANNQSCQLLADTIRKTPEQYVDSIQLQFTVSAAKIDSKVINVKSEHVSSSQLVAALKNMPNADGPTRYLSSNDYNRMLWQISNQVLVSEVTSGDYVDADDELSLKEVIAQMFQTQKENTAQFDDKMWNSVFWDPLDERPDKITNELNKVLFINQTDHRAYLTHSGTSSTSAKVSGIMKVIGGGASHTSSSSMTTDDLSHLLEVDDVESEIQGEKFVPKKLDLQRLNVNDLSRQDLLATKRVRVRQVDIGGVLQVDIGNSSADAAEDENRRLRQQVADLQKSLSDLTSSQAKTQASINVLQANVSGLQGAAFGLRTDVTTLQGQAKYIHVPNCQTFTYPYPPGNRCSMDLVCPDGTTMVKFNSVWHDDAHTFTKKSLTCC
jgi:hypothetical protein